MPLAKPFAFSALCAQMRLRWVKTLIVLLFVAEYLDDLLAVDHFFYIAIEVG